MRSKDAQTPDGAGVGEPALKPRIDPITRLLVLRLKEAEPHRSSADIARVVGGISEASVRRLLDGRATDAKQLAQALMQSTVAERVENWERACEVAAEKGYHQPAKDYLEAAQAIDAKPTSSVTVDARPTFVLSVPYTLGALKDYQPPIDVQPEPVKSLTPGQPEAQNPASEPDGSR